MPRLPCVSFRLALVWTAVCGASFAADTPARSGATARGVAAKGPLPDPMLLDGRKEAPEKSSAVGMLGNFEIPGDENVRSGNVADPRQAAGGPSGAPAQGGGQGAPNSQNGGGASGQNAVNGQPGGGAGQRAGQGGASGAQAGGSAAGGAAGAEGASGVQGAEGAVAGAANAAGNAGANANGGGPGGGDPNATADGVQVGGLSGEGSPQGAGGDRKSRQVTIGDSAMRIEAGPPVPGAVGSQIPPGPIQHHEKGTGSGGKGASGSNVNKGVERGRSMPSGL